MDMAGETGGFPQGSFVARLARFKFLQGGRNLVDV
jgi:hypothetical protein